MDYSFLYTESVEIENIKIKYYIEDNHNYFMVSIGNTNLNELEPIIYKFVNYLLNLPCTKNRNFKDFRFYSIRHIKLF